jgi:hypothetical protein
VNERQLELLDKLESLVALCLEAGTTGDEIRVEIDETINVYEQETP